MVTTFHDIAVDLCGNDYLIPYLRHQLKVSDEDEPMSPRCAVRIVTDDDTPDTYDQALESLCSERGLPMLTLRCPNIVCTGMKGLPRRIAEGIYRGTYVHIVGNSAHISVVHAVDVARAVEAAAGQSGEYTLTDGSDTSMHALSEALAYRIGDKRIISIKARWAKLWYGSTYYHILTTDHTAESTIGSILPDLSPVTVTEYLRTHVYDEASL